MADPAVFPTPALPLYVSGTPSSMPVDIQLIERCNDVARPIRSTVLPKKIALVRGGDYRF
jgi:hypothetical protein